MVTSPPLSYELLLFCYDYGDHGGGVMMMVMVVMVLVVMMVVWGGYGCSIDDVFR